METPTKEKTVEAAVGNDGGGVGQLMDPKMKKSALFLCCYGFDETK